MRRMAAGVAILAVAAALLWMMSHRAPTPAARAAAGEDEDAATAPWSDRSSPRASRAGTPPGKMVPPPPAVIEQPAMPHARPPYSPDTFRLAAEIKPGAAEWDETPSDPNGTMVLRLRPTTYVVHAPAPITVELEVLDDKTRRHQPVARAELQLRGPGDGGNVHSADFGDDGSMLYRATLQPDDRERPKMYGHVMGQAQVQLANGKVYLLATNLVYSVDPGARVVGEYADVIRDGDLYIGMTLAVDHGGLYQVRGELFGPTGEPIAESRLVRTLDAGRARAELHFFGKAISDSGVNGPYELRDLYVVEHLSDAGYDAIGPLIDDAWRTQPYRAVDFSHEEYQPSQPTAAPVTASSPSQLEKPLPLYGARTTGPTTTPLSSPQPTVALHPDVVAGSLPPGR